MEWFIQIHRKILEWEWYDDTNTKVLFLHLLIVCNYQDQNWRWMIVKAGQRVTSLDHLSKEIWLSVQQTRTALEKLESTWEVTRQSTSLYTILTLNHWVDYNTPSNKRVTNEQQTSNKRVTTNNKDNKDNKDNKETEIVVSQPNEYQKSIKYLKEIEKEKIPEYAIKYESDWIKFCYYWSEEWKTGKIRAEWEKTFEIKRRFATWMSRKKEDYEKKEVVPERRGCYV